ncbi:hypothetical protein HDU97_003170 [Phlyctochytrium planicorne]|nr:hypothetical protein HDU97_003170 [Phlyctochytrium planicorne]
MLAPTTLILIAAACVSAQPQVILSDCTNTRINLENPSARQLIRNVAFNPEFTLDFTANTNSYTPAFSMNNVGMSLELGPQLNTQPLSFTNVDKDLKWFDGSDGNAQIASTVTVNTAASGNVNNGGNGSGTTVVTTSIGSGQATGNSTIFNADATKVAFSSFLTKAFAATGNVLFSVSGSAGTRIAAGGPAAFSFCFQNVTVAQAIASGNFTGWGGLKETTLSTPIFNKDLAAENNGVGMSQTITIKSDSTVDINMGTGNFDLIYTHDNKINFNDNDFRTPAEAISTTTIGTVKIPNFRLFRKSTFNSANVIFSLQPTAANAYAVSHFLTKYISSYDLGTMDGRVHDATPSELLSTLKGNAANLPALTEALTNTNIAVKFGSAVDDKNQLLRFIASDASIRLRGSDKPNNQGIVRATIRNPLPIAVTIQIIHDIEFDAVLTDAELGGAGIKDGNTEFIKTFSLPFNTGSKGLFLNPGESVVQDFNFLYNDNVDDKIKGVIAKILFNDEVRGYIRTSLKVTLLNNSQPVYIKYATQINFKRNTDLPLPPRIDVPTTTVPPPTQVPEPTATFTNTATSVPEASSVTTAPSATAEPTVIFDR